MEMQLEQHIFPIWEYKLSVANESLGKLMSILAASHGAHNAKQRSI